jgi:hypothetical protein
MESHTFHGMPAQLTIHMQQLIIVEIKYHFMYLSVHI